MVVEEYVDHSLGRHPPGTCRVIRLEEPSKDLKRVPLQTLPERPEHLGRHHSPHGGGLVRQALDVTGISSGPLPRTTVLTGATSGPPPRPIGLAETLGFPSLGKLVRGKEPLIPKRILPSSCARNSTWAFFWRFVGLLFSFVHLEFPDKEWGLHPGLLLLLMQGSRRIFLNMATRVSVGGDSHDVSWLTIISVPWD